MNDVRVTAAMVGLGVYLWVIHSFRAELAQPALILGLVALAISTYNPRLPAPLVWFGAFVLWSALTFPASKPGVADSEVLLDYSKFWLIFLVSCNAVHNKRQLHILLVLWLGIFAVYPVRGTLINFAIGNSFFGRYAWNFTFRNPNDLAALTLPILAMSIAVLQGQGQAKWIRLSAIAGVLVLPLMIIITQSRGGILALASLGLLVLVQYRRQARGYALAFLSVGVVVLTAPPDVWDRLKGLLEVGTDSASLSAVDQEESAEQRFEIWKVAIAITKANPLTGVGLGGYPVAHRQMASSTAFAPIARGARDTHSLYLNLLAETGLVGFLLFAGMLSAVFWSGKNAIRNLRYPDPVSARQIQTLLFGLVALLQACLFATLNAVPYLYVYLGVICSAIAVLSSSTPGGTARRSSTKSRNLGPWSDSSSTPRQANSLSASSPYRAGVQHRPR